MATREELLVQTMVDLADTLVDDFDIVDVTVTLAERCVEILAVDSAGILLRSGDDGLQVMASSDARTETLEAFEVQIAEGPCPDCVRTGEPVLSADLAAEIERWPTFAPTALATGIRSAHAVPMRLRDTVIGALNLFRAETGLLTEADVAVAQAFADITTIAVLQHRQSTEARALNDQLTQALSSRVTIEQAKGVISEQAGIAVDAAFEVLRAFARHHNRKVTVVAQQVLAGDLDAAALRTVR